MVKRSKKATIQKIMPSKSLGGAGLLKDVRELIEAAREQTAPSFVELVVSAQLQVEFRLKIPRSASGKHRTAFRAPVRQLIPQRRSGCPCGARFSDDRDGDIDLMTT